MLSQKLLQALRKIQPENYELSLADTVALYDLTSACRYSDIRLREHGIELNNAGQGESSKWGTIISFPLSVTWETTEFIGSQVTFSPVLGSVKLHDEKWLFDALADTFKKTHPSEIRFLEEPVSYLEGAEGIFYCLNSELQQPA